MKTIVGLALVGQPPTVNGIRPAAYGLARPVGPEWQPGVLVVENSLEPHDTADLEITPKEISDEGGMLLDFRANPARSRGDSPTPISSSSTSLATCRLAPPAGLCSSIC
jgi:hypothetical protein